MKRIDTSTRAIDLFGAGKDGFKDGNLALGVAPTDFNAGWCNRVQEEISNVIETAGLVLDPNDNTQLLRGFRMASPGRLIGLQVFAASATLTPAVGALMHFFRAVGGGGGGGGTPATSAGQIALGSAGSGGSYAELLVAAASRVITIGPAGTAGAGVAGGAGGATSVGSVLTCPGGLGGAIGVIGAGVTGPAPSPASPSGANILSVRGQPGQYAAVVQSGGYYPGLGGSSPFGTGGTGITGQAATGYGAGGGGGLSGPSTAVAQAGQAGTGGYVICFEYGAAA